jgi:hypothetical protein
MTLRGTIMTLEAAIHAEAIAWAKTKIDPCIAYSTRETQNIGQGIVPSS